MPIIQRIKFKKIHKKLEITLRDIPNNEGIDYKNNFCKLVEKLTKEDILIMNVFGSKISECDIDATNPTGCGVSGNIIPFIIGKLYNKNSYRIQTMSLDNIDNIMETNNHPNIYLIGFDDTLDFFPGHVFIIWQYGADKYLLVQSYINSYPITATEMTKKELHECVEQWDIFSKNTFYNKTSLNIWKRYTKNSIDEMKNYKCTITMYVHRIILI